MEDLQFIHLSDTHLGCDQAYQLQGVNTFESFQGVLRAIDQLSDQIAFVIHTGDIVADPDDQAYQFASDLLRQIKVPVYLLPGNHDSRDDMRKFMHIAPCDPLDSTSPYFAYTFSFGRFHFIALDADRLPDSPAMAHLAEAQLRFLDKTLAGADEQSTTVFLHYPVLRFGSPWVDRMMMLENGEELHQVLSRHSAKVRAVLFGHLHRPLSHIANGVHYSSGKATCFHFHALQSQEIIAADHTELPGFQLVKYFGDQTLIQSYSTSKDGLAFKAL